MPPERKPLTRAPKKETPDIEDWWTEGHKEAVKARAGAVEVATDPQEYKHAIEPNDTLRILKEIWGRGNEASVTSIGRQKPKGYVPGSAGETAFYVKMQAVPKSWAPTEAKKALVGGERGAATVANQERHVLTGVWSPDRGGWRSVSRDTVMKIEEPATGRIWIGAKRAPSQQIANEAQVARAKTEQVKQVQKAGRRMQEAAEQLPEPKPVGIPEVSPGEEATPALTRETMLSKLGEIMQRGGQTLKTTHTTGGIVKSLLRAGVKSIPLGAGAYTGSQIGSILGPVGAMAGGVAGGIAATGGVRATTMAVTRALSKGTAGFRALLRSLSLPRELQGPVQQIAHKVISGKIDPVIAAWTLQNLPGFSEWSEENGSRELGVYREP
ncbi:MAG: hypothetical protein LUQ69_09715 [Methanoregulaceae archaeon]|nr:hypothetical protein [Methanoregulaceae archaeon]